MPMNDVVIIVVWGIMCNVWSVLLWMQRRVRRDGTLVSASMPADFSTMDHDGNVCVVIPARNEASGIADCLASVLTQDISNLRVIVADDRSDDHTAAIVMDIARRDARVSLIQINELPSGWLGKSHALSRATQNVSADWLLFLDVDCRLISPVAIRASIHEAQRRRASLFTLLPALETGSFWEGMLIPLCSAVMALWYGRSNRPRATGFANGQFLLIKHDVYQSVGGHAAVRRAIIEDMPLAQRVRAAGYITWAGGGAELVCVRMYDSLRATFAGWSRIFVGALRSPFKIAVSVAWLIAGSLWPIIAVPFLINAWLTTGAQVPASLASMTSLCLTHLVLLTLVSYGFWGLGRCDRRYLWLYPMSVIMVIGILSHAFWTMTFNRRIGWRTTYYRFDRRAQIIESSESSEPVKPGEPVKFPTHSAGPTPCD